MCFFCLATNWFELWLVNINISVRYKLIDSASYIHKHSLEAFKFSPLARGHLILASVVYPPLNMPPHNAPQWLHRCAPPPPAPPQVALTLPVLFLWRSVSSLMTPPPCGILAGARRSPPCAYHLTSFVGFLPRWELIVGASASACPDMVPNLPPDVLISCPRMWLLLAALPPLAWIRHPRLCLHLSRSDTLMDTRSIA
jgi:hypothetical protein